MSDVFYTEVMEIITRAVYFFVLALAFALFEVESEGKHGWSARSQTWFVLPKHFPNWLKRIFNKPLTGYHIFVFVAAFFVSHWHFFMGVSWSWKMEFQALAIYLAWSPLWDYLWLLFNPHYGVSKLGSGGFWWYKESWWVGGLVPFENVGQWILSLLFAFLAGKFFDQIVFLGILSGLTLVSAFTLAPLYQKWSRHMRRIDDRKTDGKVDMR